MRYSHFSPLASLAASELKHRLSLIASLASLEVSIVATSLVDITNKLRNLIEAARLLCRACLLNRVHSIQLWLTLPIKQKNNAALPLHEQGNRVLPQLHRPRIDEQDKLHLLYNAAHSMPSFPFIPYVTYTLSWSGTVKSRQLLFVCPNGANVWREN